MSTFTEQTKKYLIQGMHLGKGLERYLLSDEYFPEIGVFPPFLKFTMSEISRVSGSHSQNSHDPIRVTAPKSLHNWRDFSIIHPGNYESIVRLISSNQYKEVVGSLIGKMTKIGCYSLPLRGDGVDRKTSQINQWLKMQEDITKEVKSYKYILQTDISNCYHSLYTHVIEWACQSALSCHSGQRKCTQACFGNQLDSAIRASMSGRTHGLPVGPRITDYIAEVCLLYLDRAIEKEVGDSFKYSACRYKDNYYVLCQNESDCNKVLKIIGREARKLHLHINGEKTSVKSIPDYFSGFWQNEFESIATLLPPGIWSYQKVRSYLVKTYNLSASHGHGKAIFDKALVTLRGWHKKLPRKSRDSFEVRSSLFNLVSALCVARPESMPMTLGYLEELIMESGELQSRFNGILLTLLEDIEAHDSFFEVLWVTYFCVRSMVNLDIAKDKIEKVIGDQEKTKLAKIYLYLLDRILSNKVFDRHAVTLFDGYIGPVIFRLKDPRKLSEIPLEYLNLQIGY